MDTQTIVLLILGIIFVVFFFVGCKPKPVIPNPPGPEPLPPEPSPEPIPDPNKHKWHLVDTSTSRWAAYVEYMTNTKKITKDSLLALELMKTINGEKHYVWTAEIGDYWDLPDEVWESGKVDCDGFARLTADVLGRFIKCPYVWWLGYYGYYRYYFLKDDKWQYSLKLGGHAITVYKKNEELLAFSNTQWWWNNGFEDFIDIGEMTFPEGIIHVECRHWETGELVWVADSEEGRIIEGSNIFNRSKKVIRNAPKLDKNNLPELI